MMEQMNQSIMWGHLVMLLLVLLSTMLFYTYWYKLIVNPTSIKVNIETLRAWQVSTWANFLA